VTYLDGHAYSELAVIDAGAAAVWSSLLAAARELVPLKADAARTGRASLIDAARASLADLRDRRCALEVLTWLEPEVTLALFDDVVRVAAHTQRDALLTRQVLGRLPRRMLVERIDPIVDQLLAAADDDVYRRLAELMRHLGLDSTLARIVDRALASTDPNIRDVGSDFDLRVRRR
jgi:hypothetical protein